MNLQALFSTKTPWLTRPSWSMSFASTNYCSAKQLADIVAGVSGTKLFSDNVKQITQELQKWHETEEAAKKNIVVLESTLEKEKKSFAVLDRIDGK